MIKCALLPGSFDPLTKRHLDTVERAARLFDEVIISVFINTSKNSLSPPEERTILIAKAVAHLPGVEVIHQGNQLTVETAEEIGTDTLVRGIRNIRDFEYEREIVQMNHHLNGELEMVFLLVEPEYNHISSSTLKEVLYLSGGVSSYLPSIINKVLTGKREPNKS